MRIRTLEDAKTDQDAFIRTICEYPHDLRLRLVYADWLDENAAEVACAACNGKGVYEEYGERIASCGVCHGTGRRSNGFAERAEFVRLNCEIAAALRPGMDIIDSPEFGRQEVLFSDHIMRWRMECAVNLLPHWAKRNHYTGDVCAIWRSGFVEEIRCPLDWWVGGECECFTNEPDAHCPTCHGTGRTPANGPAVVTKHPVTRAVVSDREPMSGGPGAGWLWFRDQSRFGPQPLHPESDLPPAIRDRLTTDGKSGLAIYPTREAAVEALSRALVDWAREQAGLTPIPWEVSQ